MNTEKEILEARNAVYQTQRDLGQRISSEKRGMTDDEREQYDKAEAEYSALTEQLTVHRSIKEKKAEQADAEYAARGNHARGDEAPMGDAKAPDYRSVFNKIHRFGYGGLNSQERAVASEYRAQVKGTDSAGGYIVPEYWDGELITTMKAFGGMMQVATIERTPKGGVLYYPTLNDTGNEGEWVAEYAQMGGTDLVFGQTAMNDFKLGSGITPISIELAQDETYNLEGVLTNAFGRRLGVSANKAYTTGDGTGKPTGIVGSTTIGVTGATTAGITHGEMIKLKHAIDPAYRAGGQGRYMFNDSTLSEIKLLTIGSGDARPLWQPAMSVGAPDTIDGSSYVINQQMADLGAGLVPVLFGDFSKYTIRIVKDITSFTFLEKYMDRGAIGYVAYMRTDGKLLDPNGVAKFTNAAS